LLAKLRTIEAQIVEIDRQVAFSKPKELSAVLDQARESSMAQGRDSRPF
jgi:hypothetical protein